MHTHTCTLPWELIRVRFVRQPNPQPPIQHIWKNVAYVHLCQYVYFIFYEQADGAYTFFPALENIVTIFCFFPPKYIFNKMSLSARVHCLDLEFVVCTFTLFFYIQIKDNMHILQSMKNTFFIFIYSVGQIQSFTLLLYRHPETGS